MMAIRNCGCAEAWSRPEAAAECAVGAQRRGLDDAEHSTMLKGVMAE
jgi:hypothetical protein